MQTLWQDLRYGARMLFKNSGFTLIAVLSLSLGIGANSAVFSLIDAVLLRPLPVAEPNRLVALTTSDQHSTYPHGLSYRDYLDYRDNQAFTGALAYEPVSLNLANAGQSGANERIWGVMASGNYFDVLGVRAALGRSFAPEEDRSAQPVAVLSHELWQRRFGGDAQIVGKQMQLNGHSFTIIGVAPANFSGTEVLFTPAVWVLAQMHQQLAPGSAGMLEARDAHGFRVWARLKAGVSQEQAQTAASLQARQLEQAYPATNRAVNVRLYPQWEARIEPGTGQIMAGAAALLMALVFIVLLIACANVANLMLARVAGRRKEISIRLAIGANRWRLIRQLLTESFLLALLGGGVALLLAWWGADVIASLRPSGDLPIGLSARLDGRVLGFTVLAALLTTFLFGLAPAWQASKADLVPALKGEEIAPTQSRRFSLRNVLVVAQVALSALLLLCAGLFVRSLAKAQTMDLGLRTQGMLLATLDVGLNGYDETRGRAFYRDLLDRARALPGVEAVSAAHFVPLDFSADGEQVVIEGRAAPPEQEKVSVLASTVSLNYFAAAGTRLVAGRDFTAQDDASHPLVAIINETMARTYWPQTKTPAEVIGKRLYRNDRNSRPLEIVGIAQDGKYRSYFEDPQPYLYLPHEQRYNGALTLVVKTSADAASVTAALRREVAALDPSLPLSGVRTIEDFLQARTWFGPRLISSLLGIFGLIGLLLAVIGIYGVMSYLVAQRTREIGVRLALGATSRDVLTMVIRQGMTVAALGLGAGVLAGLALTRLMAGLLYGISATDPLTFLTIPLALALAALLACWIPARRATKVDPLIALRCE